MSITDKKIAVIANPLGGYNKCKNLKKFKKHLDPSWPYHEVSTPNDIKNALIQLAQYAPEILIINAGDGTVDLIITYLKHNQLLPKCPTLALLQGGTTNLIHRDIGMRASPEKAIQQIKNNQAQSIQRKALKITHDDSHDVLYGFFLGIGAIPKAIKHTRKTLHQKGWDGKLSELLVFIKLITRLYLRKDLKTDPILHPVSFKLNDNQQRCAFLILTTLKKLIAGVKSPATQNALGALSIDEARKLNRMTYETITLELKEPWVLDGEFQSEGTIHVTLSEDLTFLSDQR